MSKDTNDNELLHSGMPELDNHKRTNFSVQSPSDKTYNIEYMTGNKKDKGADKK